MNESLQSRISLLPESVCEAFACAAKSTKKIAIPVGDKGSIFLFVCDSCLSKFGSEVKAKFVL
jgi:hypothetical protein